VIGYAASNPAFAKAFRARIGDGQRAQLTGLLQSAIDQGQLRAGLDIDIALDVLLGPILYRRFMQTTVPPELPQHLVDSFWRSNAPEHSSERAADEKRNTGPNGKRPNRASKHQKMMTRRVG
jgi:hypothetical protein